MITLSRRDFLKTAGLGAAALSLDAVSWGRAAGANSDIRVAQVGFHSQGAGHINTLNKMPGVRLVALCDVDRHVLEKKAQELGGGIQTYTDIRKLLDNKDIECGLHRRAQSLARLGHHLGLPGRQRRLCRETRLPQSLRRPQNGRGRP